jgi:hypothetical protein
MERKRDTCIFDLGANCRFTSRTLCPRYPLDMRLGGPQSPESVWAIWRSEDSLSYRNSKSDPWDVQPLAVAIRETDFGGTGTFL